MEQLRGKRILIGITGSIAAYKIPLLIRLLKKAKAEVQILLTPTARDFVTPLTLSTLSENPVYTLPFDLHDGKWNSHVEFAQWADVMLIAPASANTIGKLVNGISDNLLITTYLSAKSKVFIAPAMDLDMYQHPSTKRNIDLLKSYGNLIIEPREGELASGLSGAGRMEEPEQMAEVLNNFFKKKTNLTGKKVLLTAGPTYEAIDPVRFIGNHSSGKMGFEIARELCARGAEVTLISGPSNESFLHPNLQIVKISSADEMYDACHAVFSNMDIAILAAAVADFKPSHSSKHKIKKQSSTLTIELVQTKDILKSLGEIKRNNQILIGFALETENEISNAEKKLKSKNLDFIVLNSLKDEGAGFGTDTNKITILSEKHKAQSFVLKSKSDIAKDILDYLELM